MADIATHVEGEYDDPDDDEAGPEAGEGAGLLHGDETLHPEGHHQLHAPEAGHQVGGDQLQGLGQGGEGQQPGQRQACILNIQIHIKLITRIYSYSCTVHAFYAIVGY